MAIIIVFQGGHLEALAPPGLPFTVSGALLAESPRQTLYNILCTSSYRNLRLPTKHCVQWRFDMILKTSIIACTKICKFSTIQSTFCKALGCGQSRVKVLTQTENGYSVMTLYMSRTHIS